MAEGHPHAKNLDQKKPLAPLAVGVLTATAPPRYCHRDRAATARYDSLSVVSGVRSVGTADDAHQLEMTLAELIEIADLSMLAVPHDRFDF